MLKEQFYTLLLVTITQIRLSRQTPTKCQQQAAAATDHHKGSLPIWLTMVVLLDTRNVFPVRKKHIDCILV